MGQYLVKVFCSSVNKLCIIKKILQSNSVDSDAFLGEE